jgi:ABC-type uncharacterized transport system substrate-binding protein
VVPSYLGYTSHEVGAPYLRTFQRLDVGDPVAYGLVSNLERPGGNVTEVSSVFSDLAPVHLELLRLAVPGASRVVVLWNPDNLAEHRL